MPKRKSALDKLTSSFGRRRKSRRRSPFSGGLAGRFASVAGVKKRGATIGGGLADAFQKSAGRRGRRRGFLPGEKFDRWISNRLSRIEYLEAKQAAEYEVQNDPALNQRRAQEDLQPGAVGFIQRLINLVAKTR